MLHKRKPLNTIYSACSRERHGGCFTAMWVRRARLRFSTWCLWGPLQPLQTRTLHVLVNLQGTAIRSHLDCKKGQFVNLGSCSILANNAHISNGVLFRNGFYAEGEVRLFAAT